MSVGPRGTSPRRPNRRNAGLREKYAHGHATRGEILNDHIGRVLVALVLSLARAVAAEDAGVAELREKLAVQEALLRQALDGSAALRAQVAEQAERLCDLNAKLVTAGNDAGRPAQAVTSIRKNARIAIGGTLAPRYTAVAARFDSSLTREVENGKPVYGRRDDNRMVGAEDYRHGDLRIREAKLEIAIDVTPHLDAFVKLDLQDTNVPRSDVSGIAQNYWLRWKNIGNSGFGVLVGRDRLKYGDKQPIGLWAGWNKGMNDITGIFYTAQSEMRNYDGTKGNGMFANDNLIPTHTTYDWLRTTQINPYWESGDGALRLDLSLFQALDRFSGMTKAKAFDGEREGTSVRDYRSINHGFGSAALRAQWRAAEGLKLTAGAMNLYAQNRRGYLWGPEGRWSGGDYGVDAANHNFSVNLAFQYRPPFLRRINLWGQWTHGWNEAWVRDMSSDTANFGVSFDLTPKLTAFAQGDYLRVANRQSALWNRARGWAFYTGAVLALRHGVAIEGGWRHERVDYRDGSGLLHSRLVGDIFYSQLTFGF